MKLNGIRVEPAEVEAALLSHPAVRSVVVVVDKRAPTGLAALVVSDAQSQFLRAFAATRLPRHLVPDVVCVQSLPRTPHGKVDLASVTEAYGAALAGSKD